MAFENYTIRQFQNAWFNEDRSVMTKEQFDEVYTEYIDTADLFQSEEFAKISYIHFLNNRINSIKLSLKLQRDFILTFHIPYIPGLEFLKKFGHNIVWNTTSSQIHFLESLDNIEIKEKKYISKLEEAIKQLKESKAKKPKQEDATPKEARAGFVRTVISLGKMGYRIDNDKTTVEELAYMIKQQSDESKKAL